MKFGCCLDLIDSLPPESTILNKDVFGSRIISPNGKVLTVRKNEKHALVCDRAAFDQFLFDRLHERGTQVYQPYKAVDVRRVENGIEVSIRSKQETRTLFTRILISAEGAGAKIANKMGMDIRIRRTM